MSHPRLVTITAILLGLAWPAQGEGSVEAVPVIELERGNVYNPRPFASPGGNQIVTYMRQGVGTALLFTERSGQGGRFATPAELSNTGNFEEPSISFTPGDGLYAIWGIAAGAAPAEQTFRPAGGDFAATQPANGCHRFVDSASSPEGAIAVACQHKLASNPPETIRFGTSQTLGLVAVDEDLMPPAYDPFVRADLTWGDDGTIAIISQGRKTTTNPPPANETTRVRASIKSPAAFFTADIAEATWPNEVHAGPPVILDDGTVLVGLSGSAGARIMTRPPGALTVFTPAPVAGNGIWGMGSDSSRNVHVGSGESDARQYSSQTRTMSGEISTPFPIPLPVITGGGDAYLTGFEVAPDGTEYALIRGDDGTYATFREPGRPFSAPVKLGDDSSGNPDSTLTAEGDLLVTWAHENGVGDYTIEFSGLDKTPPKVTVGNFPVEAEASSPVVFSASATDAFGIGSVEWSFDGVKVAGSEVAHTFTAPGVHQVAFTATDVAGQRTVVSRAVTVPGSPEGPGNEPDLVMSLRTPKMLAFRTLKKRGVRVVVTGQPAVRIKVTLGASRKNARLRPLKTRIVTQFRSRHALRVRPNPARIGKRRSFRLVVQVIGTTRSGQRVTRSRQVRVRR